jgi:ATP-dependent Clp protease ATP-binding subunit ClpB
MTPETKRSQYAVAHYSCNHEVLRGEIIYRKPYTRFWVCEACFNKRYAYLFNLTPTTTFLVPPKPVVTDEPNASEVTEVELDPSQDAANVQRFARELRRKVIGQEVAIDAMVAWYRRRVANLHDATRPVASVLMLGPTGTGKTRLVEAVAEAMHGNSQKMIKVNCAEFQSEHEIAKLIGAPPGYVGHDVATGGSTKVPPRFSREAISANQTSSMPVTLILLDEVEKAGTAMLQLLLGILDKGSMVDGHNQTVDFTNCVIIATSNLGARQIEQLTNQGESFGFAKVQAKEAGLESIESAAVTAARKHFAPEFWNRLDTVVVYQPLSTEAIRQITRLEVDKITDRALGKAKIVVDDAVTNHLAEIGYSSTYGARFLRRTVERELLDPLTRILSGSPIKGTLHVRLKDGRLKFIALKPTTRTI